MSRDQRLGRNRDEPHDKDHAKETPAKKPDSPEIGRAIADRRQYGSTEKILRRNRKLWTRLGNKRRRRLDKEACVD